MGNNSAKLDVYRNEFIAPTVSPYVMNAAGAEVEPEMNKPSPNEVDDRAIHPGTTLTT